ATAACDWFFRTIQRLQEPARRFFPEIFRASTDKNFLVETCSFGHRRDKGWFRNRLLHLMITVDERREGRRVRERQQVAPGEPIEEGGFRRFHRLAGRPVIDCFDELCLI